MLTFKNPPNFEDAGQTNFRAGRFQKTSPLIYREHGRQSGAVVIADNNDYLMDWSLPRRCVPQAPTKRRMSTSPRDNCDRH